MQQSIDTSNYEVREVIITGKWIVIVPGSTEPISEHETKAEAQAAIKRYVAGDRRRAARR